MAARELEMNDNEINSNQEGTEILIVFYFYFKVYVVQKF